MYGANKIKLLIELLKVFKSQKLIFIISLVQCLIISAV